MIPSYGSPSPDSYPSEDSSNLRSEEHPFHGKLRALYDHLNELKSSAQSQQSSATQQGPNPAQLQAMQQMAAGQATAQVLGQQNALMQQAIQSVQQMDPISRFQVAQKLRMNALATGGMGEGQDYLLNDRALAAKEYPNAFGDMGKRAQQILLASGILDHRQHPMADFHSARNYLV
jgi:hypothetical protein